MVRKSKSEENSRRPEKLRPFNLKLLLVDRQTDILAFVAFLISVFNLSVALVWLMRGPEPILMYPDTVTLVGFNYHGQNGKRYLRVANDMVYINNGDLKHNAILTKETVSITIDKSKKYKDSPIKQTWFSFETSVVNGDIKWRKDIKQSLPIAIGGQNVAGHYTYFAPNASNCNTDDICDEWWNYLEIDEFVNEIKNIEPKYIDADAGDKRYVYINVKYLSEYHNSDQTEITCKVRIYESDLKLINNKNRKIITDGVKSEEFNYGWFSRNCEPIGEYKL